MFSHTITPYLTGIPATEPPARATLDVTLRRRLGDFLLDIAFATSAGRTVLFGPSGAGKSLTLRALAGLLSLDSGLITFAGETWHDSSTHLFVPPQARRVGYLPQQYALFPHLTVTQNIAFGQRTRGSEARRRTQELVRLLRLQGLERQRPAHLSGGQQQRVALARALAAEPGLLLLDEPWSALDTPVRATLREELLHFHEQFQVPMLLVTHDISDVQTIAEQVIVIAQGRVLQTGTPEQIFRAPRTRQVAALVGMNSCWSGTIQALELAAPEPRAIIATSDGLLSVSIARENSLSVGQSIEFALRTDEIILSAASETRNAQGGSIAGTVLREQARGTFYAITVGLPSQVLLEIPVPRWQRRELEIVPGSQITLTIPPAAVHLFL